MKHSIKGLFVVLTIVMSFVLIQGVYAREDFETLIFKGEVKSVDDRAIRLDTDGDGDIDVTIDHMGPSWYWDDVVEIPYPSKDDILEIEAFYCDVLGDYVGVSVCYVDQLEDGTCLDSIQLRDPDTLKPLWNTNAKTTDLFDTAAEATGEGEPNDYSHDYNYDKNYDNNYNSPGPHGK